MSEFIRDQGRFIVEEYKERLKMLREIVSGENQQDFADRIGIPFKRWNNYERGYPIPRETAFILMEKFKGVSVEWIWFGMEGNLSTDFRQRILALEAARRDEITASRRLSKAKADLEEKQSRRRKLHDEPAGS
jgi:transcriptional regulator with XRE-family HTH domain